MSLDIEDLASFCKKKSLVFPSSSIYDGFSGFWDYGPNGVEIKRNIKNSWWNSFVSSRDDIVGVDGSIIAHPKVWQASGHADGFSDPLTTCNKCGTQYRVDHLLEEVMNENVEGLSEEKLSKLLKKHGIKCEKCDVQLNEVKEFNLMFKTGVGPVIGDKSVTYLRPETAQTIFTNVKNVLDTKRVKPPFGIAQVGKAFRNEISPRNFLFRSREFTQMEIEFFNLTKRISKEYSSFIKNNYDKKVKVLSKNNKTVDKTVKELRDDFVDSDWILYWILRDLNWLESIGVNPNKLRLRRHSSDELSHYSSETWDIEYEFDFGFKEIIGIADRGRFDLKQHQKHSNEKLTYYDESSKKRKLLKTVAEPSIGLDRVFLAVIDSAYWDDKDNKRTVLRLVPGISTYDVAVFPLVKKKGLPEIGKTIHEELKNDFASFYDESGSIGRRYRRQDELGTPFCITVDFDTKKDNTVTVRDRDTLEQDRVKISKLHNYLSKKIN